VKPKLLRLWTSVATEVAALSTCTRLQVGALLISLDGERLLAYGYNGGPRGGPNVPLLDEQGNDFWIHAEANALVKTRPVEPFHAILTHTPCLRCASLLINAGVEKVVAMDLYRDLAGWDLLQRQLLDARGQARALLFDGSAGQVASWLSY
jgi:dCMP deaminase